MYKKVAALCRVSKSTVERVMRAHKKRVEAAMEDGKSEHDVRVPKDTPETRQREPEVKDRHLDFVVRCMSKMIHDNDLEQVPTLRYVYVSCHLTL